MRRVPVTLAVVLLTSAAWAGKSKARATPVPTPAQVCQAMYDLAVQSNGALPDKVRDEIMGQCTADVEGLEGDPGYDKTVRCVVAAKTEEAINQCDQYLESNRNQVAADTPPPPDLAPGDALNADAVCQNVLAIARRESADAPPPAEIETMLQGCRAEIASLVSQPENAAAMRCAATAVSSAALDACQQLMPGASAQPAPPPMSAADHAELGPVCDHLVGLVQAEFAAQSGIPVEEAALPPAIRAEAVADCMQGLKIEKDQRGDAFPVFSICLQAAKNGEQARACENP